MPPERVTLLTQWHAYIICSVIGIRCGRIMPTSGTAHPVLGPIMKEYLCFAFPEEDQGWEQRKVMDAFRNLSGVAVKKETKKAFPSLFPKNRKAMPLGVPEELKDGEDVRFDLNFINRLREKVKLYKQELAMNEQTDGDATEATALEAPTTEATSKKKTSAPTKINFLTPKGIDVNTLTVENYREVTGHRYRKTKDQTERKLTREQAFEESKALALTQGAE